MSCIGKIEEDVQSVKRKINEVKSEVQEKISFLEKRICDLEERPINSLPSSEVIYSRPTVKPLTFDGQTSRTVFKTQFDVVNSSNGWMGRVKASQLVASLQGSAAEVLQGIPAGNLTDLTTIERALESRFGDSHLTQFYRTELKKRRQKSGESLQVLPADVERLMSLAYAECPLDIRKSLAAQYFVDAIRDEDTQHSTRLEKLLNICITEKKNATRRNPNVTCWQCNKKGHLQRDFQAIKPNQENYAKAVLGGGAKAASSKKNPVEGLKISALSGKKNGLYLEGSICGVPCLMLVDAGANVTLFRTDIAQKLNQQFIYTAPNIFLKTATGEKANIHGKLDASIECGSRRFQLKVYVADITDPCILGLDFLREFNFTVDLERNEIRTGGEEIPLFSANVEFPKFCSIFVKGKTVIPARSECLIRGVTKASGHFSIYPFVHFQLQECTKA
ncbi:transposon Ty3-I Gag-Pol polyprotein [Nephila pilipes]|uniref:Transposon Ty3-I Gag-Pol polyprotein n=1 Tax=Nephila pilipes TaxID=299642 RepID=A0A8X6NKY8_NEPPI|nr:transposon Ty3-I Gag-Pol polyprotein [Nephila pilipes]